MSRIILKPSLKRPGNNMNNELRMGTWNVRTLLCSGNLKELRDVGTKKGADVIELQEI